jgi:hypothetical protein
MEGAGFVRRIARRHRNGGNKTNRYSFAGLIREAEPFAQEALKEREKRKHEKSARARSTARPATCPTNFNNPGTGCWFRLAATDMRCMTLRRFRENGA